ncbi:MAG: hypothetical protein KF830_14310, partial [Planctomycetes bacterium]|nr:hypothetical protein [Planctomycetota bacterium]
GRNPAGGRPPGMARKKLTELSAEELQQRRESLAAMPGRMRSTLDDEQANKLEIAVAAIVKAIDENRLDEAQTLSDGLMALMPRRNRGPGGPSGPGSQGGDGGGRPGN